MTSTRTAMLALIAGLVSGCAPLVQTPERFLQLERKHSAYDYRATTADGVVLAARVLDFDRKRGGGLQFWIDATKLRLQTLGGYALLGEQEVATDDGLRGKQLRFGHDEEKQPYQYWVSLFVDDDRLVVVEAGGPEAKLKDNEARIAGAIRSLNP